MLSAGGTVRRLLGRGSNASGFVAIKALVVSCAIDDEKPTCRYRSGTLPISAFLDRVTFVPGLAATRKLERGSHLYGSGVRKPAQNYLRGKPRKDWAS
jgi:hypothetical protein